MDKFDTNGLGGMEFDGAEDMQFFDMDPELEPDELAMDAAGLDDPAGATIDRILLQTWEELGRKDADPQGQLPEPPVEEFRDQEYRDTFDSDFEAVMEGGSREEPKAFVRHKRRRKRKEMKRRDAGLFGIPHFLCTMILWFIVVLTGFSAAMLVWICADDVLALKRRDKEVKVTIAETDTMEDITKKLVDAGLVRYEWLFNFYADYSNARDKIGRGEFTLNTMYDYFAIVNALGRSSVNRTEIEVVIPEGYSCRQLFALLESEGVCSAEELQQAQKTVEVDDYWFMDNLSREGEYPLEGYLFPDTYRFYTSDDPERVLRKLLNNFERKFDDAMIGRISLLNDQLAEKLAANGYDEAYIASHKMTVHDVVNIASMIEKESAGSGESDLIASVIYNRLCSPDFSYLNIDATVQYALGEHKDRLTYKDLEIDSPYNTYKVAGLPAGPIANPGISSLRAALQPEETDYYYYALDTDGTHYFTRTLEEHNAFLASLGGETEPDE